MPDWWAHLNEGQGSVLAAFVTVIGAALGVLLGARLFGNRVRNLESAVKETERLISEHRKQVEVDLTELRATLAEVLATGKQVKDSVEEQLEAKGGDAADDEWGRWYELRSSWRAIRDEIERRAANPQVDGRTRAKYARVDRRQFEELLRQLAADGRLEPHSDTFRSAFRLWQQYKNGRKIPTAAQVNTMNELRQQVTGPEAEAA